MAAGRYLRVRQLPGADNMMGAVKFMLPNNLGIYLHDTPDKSLFARESRTASSGCVRLEDAQRLARWLFGETPVVSGLNQRVDLPSPVPVYVTYFTAWPEPQGVVTRADVYGRDPALFARLGQRGGVRPASRTGRQTAAG